MDLFPPIDANGCFGADINNDGFIDVFLTDERYSNRMLINLGKGIFKDITAQTGLDFKGKFKGASFSDIDKDGDQDIYVTNWAGPDLFYRNNGNKTFELHCR